MSGLRREALLFGAKIYKISRDSQGNRLTHLKVTGGVLRVKDALIGEEKVNQIRIYSGSKYETVQEAQTGTVCAVTGLLSSAPGQGLSEQRLLLSFRYWNRC